MPFIREKQNVPFLSDEDPLSERNRMYRFSLTKTIYQRETECAVSL